jgi:AraC family transcriptional regulator
MIYRQMPALWDHAFRKAFYARWGRESAVISARTRLAEYPDFRQLLSIKAAFGGCEDYFIDGRRVSVDDDTYLIVNHGRSYSSRIEAIRPVHSFSIFFDPHLTAQVRHALLRPDELAQDGAQSQPAVEFSERLFAHDKIVSPALRHIRAVVDGGLRDEGWLEEQLLFLLERMLKSHYNRLSRESRIPSLKPATRRELLERMDLGVDYIYTRYGDPIGLRDIAVAARLSPYHFLRTFKAVHGITPSDFLNRTRAAKALRLLQTTAWSITSIAEHVGFGSRSSLFRHMFAIYDKTPQTLRRECVAA